MYSSPAEAAFQGTGVIFVLTSHWSTLIPVPEWIANLQLKYLTHTQPLNTYDIDPSYES